MFGGLNEITQDLYTNNSNFGRRGNSRDGRHKQTNKMRAKEIHSEVDLFA